MNSSRCHWIAAISILKGPWFTFSMAFFCDKMVPQLDLSYPLHSVDISCKAPVESSPPTNQHPVIFTGQMPFLSPNQQCQSTEWKISHSMDLLIPGSPGGLPTLSLTTNSSWLPLGRVAMPLISPLIPVPHLTQL